VNLKYVLGDIQTDRGNLHVDGSPDVIRLRRTTLWHLDAGSGRRPPHQSRTHVRHSSFAAKRQERNETAAQIKSQIQKGHHVGGLSFLFLKASGKELVRLGLRVLIHLGVVSERKVELLTEFGSLGVRKRVHCAGILDDPIIGLRCV